MKPPTILLPLTTTVIAAPITLSMSKATEWTVVGLVRACNNDDTSCSWTFSIATAPGDENVTPCSLVVEGSPASQSPGGPTACGNYTVTSGWSDQFGLENAFTTMSVIDYGSKLIAYPAYRDDEVSSGEVVSPDRSFSVDVLP